MMLNDEWLKIPVYLFYRINARTKQVMHVGFYKTTLMDERLTEKGERIVRLWDDGREKEFRVDDLLTWALTGKKAVAVAIVRDKPAHEVTEQPITEPTFQPMPVKNETTGEVFPSQSAAAAWAGCSVRCIRERCAGKKLTRPRKKHKRVDDYKWRAASDEEWEKWKREEESK